MSRKNMKKPQYIVLYEKYLLYHEKSRYKKGEVDSLLSDTSVNGNLRKGGEKEWINPR